jgi:phosphoglycerate kinase
MPNRLFILFNIIFALIAAFYASHHSTVNQLSKNNITMSLSSKLSITDVSLKGEKVLIRVDFNVP